MVLSEKTASSLNKDTNTADNVHSVRDSYKNSTETDDELLANLGYKNEFKREFSLVETVSFAFSIMGVVASVSSTLSFGLLSGGHVGMVWGWFIPSLFVMAVAASIAELSSSMPTSAGLYYFAAKMAPEPYGPLASWITGWANIMGQIALVCSIDFTCAQMITTAITVGSDGAVSLGAGPMFGILLAILFMHGFVCSAATKVLARLNIFYVTINVGTSIAMIIALLVCAGPDKVSTKDAFTLFENNTGWTNNGWAFLLAFTAPMWTLTGYDSAAHISEETSNASRAAPIAIMIGVGGTASLGWLIIIAASFATSSVPALLDTDLALPMGQLLLDILGKRGMLTIWSFIIVVQLVTGAAQAVDASRVVYAFARDHALPGSRFWRQIHPSTRTPVKAVWLVIICSAVCGVLGFSEAAFSSLAGASVIGLYISYATPVFLRITSGRSKFVAGPFCLGAWAVPIGAVACSWVSFITVLLVFPPASNPGADEMNYAIVIIGAVLVLSGGWWIISARKWFTGPVVTVESLSPSADSQSMVSIGNDKGD